MGRVESFGTDREMFAWWDSRPIDSQGGQHFLVEDRRVFMAEVPGTRKLMHCTDPFAPLGNPPLYQLFRYPDPEGMIELVETFGNAEDVLVWWKTRPTDPDDGQHILIEN